MQNQADEARSTPGDGGGPSRADRPDEMHAIDELKSLDPGQVLAAASEFARENPHVALAAAAGLGFLLGGGLTPRLAGALVLFAGRRFANQALRGSLEGVLHARTDDV